MLKARIVSSFKYLAETVTITVPGIAPGTGTSQRRLDPVTCQMAPKFETLGQVIQLKVSVHVCLRLSELHLGVWMTDTPAGLVK